jgi:hypothetical protein
MRKAQGARRKAQGARRKAQGARRKAQGARSDVYIIKLNQCTLVHSDKNTFMVCILINTK